MMGAVMLFTIYQTSPLLHLATDNKSTTDTSSSPQPAKPLQLSQRDSSFLSDRTTLSLLRSALVFQLCQYEAIVDWAPSCLHWAKELGLSFLVRALVRLTFFQQFCGGESADEVVPTIQRLKRVGIASILDLSVEADIGSGAVGDGVYYSFSVFDILFSVLFIHVNTEYVVFPIMLATYYLHFILNSFFSGLISCRGTPETVGFACRTRRRCCSTLY
jgi:hypothetical protein